MKNLRELIRGHTLQGEKVFNLHFQLKTVNQNLKRLNLIFVLDTSS